MAMFKPKDAAEYIEHKVQFQDVLIKLRSLIQQTELKETIKWGMPTYTINNKNVVGICAFKQFAGIWFFQGALLKDKFGVLRNAQEGKTQAMRHWYFTDVDQIDDDKVLLYLHEAIENQKKGKKVNYKKSASWEIPVQLQLALDQDDQVAKAFDQLTPGRQKEYAEFISTAKRAATVQARINKIIPMISAGKGLNDHYKK